MAPSTESFARKLEKWKQTYFVKRKAPNQNLMRYHLKVYLLPKWGKTPVELITVQAVTGSPLACDRQRNREYVGAGSR